MCILFTEGLMAVWALTLLYDFFIVSFGLVSLTLRSIFFDGISFVIGSSPFDFGIPGLIMCVTC